MRPIHQTAGTPRFHCHLAVLENVQSETKSARKKLTQVEVLQPREAVEIARLENAVVTKIDVSE